MPLRIEVENLETVQPDHRTLYVEHEGKYRLDVDLESYATGLKSALRVERESNKYFKNLKRAPSEIAALIADADEMSAKISSIDAIIRQQVERHALEKADLENQVKASQDSEKSVLRDTLLRTGLAKAKAIPSGLDLLVERLGERIRLDTVDGKRTLVILSADGVTPLQVKGKTAATFDDLANEARNEFPSLFEGTNAGGGGKQTNMSTRLPVDKILTRAEFNQLHPHDQAAKLRDGYSLVD